MHDGGATATRIDGLQLSTRRGSSATLGPELDRFEVMLVSRMSGNLYQANDLVERVDSIEKHASLLYSVDSGISVLKSGFVLFVPAEIYHALPIRDTFGGYSTFGNENVLYSCTKCLVKTKAASAQGKRRAAEPINAVHPGDQNRGGNAPARRKGELQCRVLFCPALVISPKRLNASPPRGERPQPIQQSRIGVAYD